MDFGVHVQQKHYIDQWEYNIFETIIFKRVMDECIWKSFAFNVFFRKHYYYYYYYEPEIK